MADILQYDIPRWNTGVALSGANSEKPKFWRNLNGAWIPALGRTGNKLLDVSGYNHHGSFAAVTTPAEKAGAWVEDRYTCSYVELDQRIEVSQENLGKVYCFQSKPWTIICLLKLTAAASGGYNWIGQFETDISGIQLDVAVRPTGASYSVEMGGGGSWANTRGATNDSNFWIGNWRHVVVTYNGRGKATTGNFSFYYDGINYATTSAGSYGNRENRTWLGRIGGSYSNYGMHANCAGWWAYGREFNLSEVKEHFQDPFAMFRLRTFPYKSAAAVAATYTPQVIMY